MPRKRKSYKTVAEIVRRYSEGWWWHWLFKKPKLPELPIKEEESKPQ